MKHWKKYIKKHKAYDGYYVPTSFDYDMVVVIPCYNEPNVLTTLQSLMQCAVTHRPVGVVVVVNSSEKTPDNIIQNNRETFKQLIDFAAEYNQPKLTFHALLCEDLPRKHAGVGLARKIGMEWALRGFLQMGNKDGVIISLDADCTVSNNYLTSIEQHFAEYKTNCCVLNFKHRVANNDHVGLQSAIDQYEQYIWYYRKALQFIGFPHYYHTIGSAFAVSADAYVRVGGIGRQQGGEDFYFLQKVFALGRIVELMKTYVYPEARFSDRIPFGTGPALEKIINAPEGLHMVYSIDSFLVLKSFFDIRADFYKQSDETVLTLIHTLHNSLQQFIRENNLLDSISDCNKNAASLATFDKRFFHHFDAFFIIKYLNFAHAHHFLLTDIYSSCHKLETLL